MPFRLKAAPAPARQVQRKQHLSRHRGTEGGAQAQVARRAQQGRGGGARRCQASSPLQPLHSELAHSVCCLTCRPSVFSRVLPLVKVPRAQSYLQRMPAPSSHATLPLAGQPACGGGRRVLRATVRLRAGRVRPCAGGYSQRGTRPRAPQRHNGRADACRHAQMEFFASRRSRVASTLYFVRNALTAHYTGLESPFDANWVRRSPRRRSQRRLDAVTDVCADREAPRLTGDGELRAHFRLPPPGAGL